MVIPKDPTPSAASGPISSPGSMRTALRQATAGLHGDLDRALSAAFQTRETYARFLLASRAALAALVPRIERFGVAILDDGVDRLDLIARDLAALEADSAADAPPLVPPPWQPATLGEAFGAAYVVEGSALGGLVLAKNVDLGLDLGGRATQFLRLRGTETAHHWRAFVDALEHWSATAPPADRRAALEGANGAFLTYRRAFEAAGLIARAS